MIYIVISILIGIVYAFLALVFYRYARSHLSVDRFENLIILFLILLPLLLYFVLFFILPKEVRFPAFLIAFLWVALTSALFLGLFIAKPK